MTFEELVNRPIKLKPSRIHRNYAGGLLMEQWQGKWDARDGYSPEDWVASTVEARTTEPVPNEGLSEIDEPCLERIFLRDLIQSDPGGYLGKNHAAKFGSDMGVLVKIIDSSQRLFLQVHPDRDFAKVHFNSDFGKTEAWYFLGGRSMDGQDPYILLGFKKGVTKALWKELFDKQDVAGMEQALHRFSVKAGDIFMIDSGMPHALGPGCFLIEIQEPTDYTMRVERTARDGNKLPDSFCHQGAGFGPMLDCFHYDTYTREEMLKKWYLRASTIERQAGGTRLSLVSSQQTPYFSMEKLNITQDFCDNKRDSFVIAVVISGHGKLVFDKGEIRLSPSDRLFLPFQLSQTVFKNTGEETLEVILCYPPVEYR